MSVKVFTKKICSKCGIEKEVSDFYKETAKRDGLSSLCKACDKSRLKRYYKDNKEKIDMRNIEFHRKNVHIEEYQVKRYYTYIKRKYNITASDYNDMFIEQGGRCAICGKHQSEFPSRLAIDHCHKTDKVRGLLCNACNIGIGVFDETPQIMKNAIKYLETTR